MAFCPNCGSQATGSFCPNCGTSLGTSQRPTGSYPSPSSPLNLEAPGLAENIAGALCYTPFLIGVICSLVFLFVAPYSRIRAIRFHAFQSLFLHVALFLALIAIQIMSAVLALITHGVGFLLIGLYPVVWLAALVLFIVMMVQAFQHKQTRLPIVGELAERQA